MILTSAWAFGRQFALTDGLALQLLHGTAVDGVADAAERDAAEDVLRAEIAGLAARGGR